MPLPTWEASKEIADGPLGSDGPPDGDMEGDKCPKCGQELEDDQFEQDKKRPR